MRTRIIIWSCVGCLAALTAGIVIWESRRSGHFQLEHVYFLLFITLFLVLAPLKILQAIALSRAEAGMPLPRRMVVLGQRLGWVYVSLFIVVAALYLYLDRHELKETWDDILYWKVITTGHK